MATDVRKEILEVGLACVGGNIRDLDITKFACNQKRLTALAHIYRVGRHCWKRLRAKVLNEGYILSPVGPDVRSRANCGKFKLHLLACKLSSSVILSSMEPSSINPSSSLLNNSSVDCLLLFACSRTTDSGKTG